MKSFKGNILSEGVAIGKPVFLDFIHFDESFILEEEIDEEIQKYQTALKKSEKQIIELKKQYLSDKVNITNEILNTHLEILSDPIINKDILDKIKIEKKSIEKAFKDVIDDYKLKIKDAFFKERIKDILDVFKRISYNLRSIKVNKIQNLNKNVIIISNEIIPSDVFEFDDTIIHGYISKYGSYVSHSAIIARSKRVPFISNIDIDEIKKEKIKNLIIDAYKGILIVNPTVKILNQYKNNKGIKKEDIKNTNLNIFANITSKKQILNLEEKNIKGIGLLRSELFFLENKKIPDVETQFINYFNIIKKIKQKPFVIRLFDFGADKTFETVLNIKKIDNPYFGDRGVRFLLKNKNILLDQIRAILKASYFGNIYLLIPFVIEKEEILQIKEAISKIKNELKNAKVLFGNIKIGSMIETPASIFNIDEILDEVDFDSIGSNALTKYLTAKEKFNIKTLHSSIKKALEIITKRAKEKNKTLLLCV